MTLKHLLVIAVLGTATTSIAQSLVNNPCTFPYPAGAQITIDAPCVNVSTAGMTSIFNPGTCGSSWGQPDGWAWFQGNGSNVDVTFASTLNDPIMHVLTISGTPCTFSSSLCADNTGSGGTETININTVAGTYYLIMIEEYYGDLGYVTNGCLSVTTTTPPVPGCTNPSAINYNPLATVDDGSCVFPTADYTMSTSGVQGEFVGACLVSDCGPFTFTDDGDFSGNYSNNVGITCCPHYGGIYRVFCPNTAGNCLRVTFNSFETEFMDDYLQVKNGPTQNSPDFTAAPASANTWGFSSLHGNLQAATPFSFTSTDPSGCLTFRFHADGSINYGGWDATIQCVPCAGGPNGTDNNDCINATPICSSASISSNATGPGIAAEGCSGNSCPAGGENHTNWYTFTVQSGGTLNFLINPDDNNDDYDYAVYGPNVSCGSLGAPVRCSDAAVTGNTGLQNVSPNQNTEDVTGDGYTETMNVTTGDQYYLVIDEWSPNAGSGYTLSFSGTASLDCTVLPVELSEFNVNYVPDEHIVDLHWITQSERDNDRFEVERSTDGEHYEVIHTVKGAGTTNLETQYYVADSDPNVGVNYYRLNQFDIDGNSKYSEVQSVNILDNAFDLLSFYPNPTSGSTEVIFNSYKKEEVRLNVFSFDGSRIVSTDLQALPGGNRFDLDLSGIEGNVFMVTITTSEKVYSGRLIKQ